MKIERLRSRFAGANQGQTQTNVRSDLPPATTIHLSSITIGAMNNLYLPL
jgi:hypothetical protein